MKIIDDQRKFVQSGATSSINFRHKQLLLLAQLLKQYEPQITKALYKDLRKPGFESYVSEIGSCLHELNYVVRNLRKWMRLKKKRNELYFPFSKSFVQPEPYGSVLIIAPWNFPFHLTFMPLIGALAAGNSVVIKPSEIAPNCSNVIAQMCEHFSDKIVYCEEGGLDVAKNLLRQKFDYIFFTGSTMVGSKVMEAASHYITPLTLELGGKSPCYVDASCDLIKAAERIVWGKFINAGQVCIAPDYCLVHEDVFKDFLVEIKNAVERMFGDARNNHDYGRIISVKHIERLRGLLKGQKVYYGGDIDVSDMFIQPTIVLNPKVSSSLMQEEIFGPILPLLKVKSVDRALELINRKDKPLALYVFSSRREVLKKFVDSTSSGGVCLNDVVTHVS